MSQIDYRREMVFVAEDQRGILGEMRLWLDINHNELEFAIMVAPEAQGTGLAGLLMDKTVRYGKSLKVSRLVADVLPENGAMLGLAKHFGCSVGSEDEIMKVTKSLD